MKSTNKLHQTTTKRTQRETTKNHLPLYVSEVIEADGETYFLPIGHGIVEGAFKGRMSLQTVKGDFIVTHEPPFPPIFSHSFSHAHDHIMQQLIEAEDDAMMH